MMSWQVSMPSKLIVGAQPYLGLAAQLWKEINPDLELIQLEIEQDANYYFDLSTLSQYSAEQTTAFVVWSHQFLNFRRLELMGEFKKLGFHMPPLIAKGAYVGESARIGENCFICPGASISQNVIVGYNSFIGFSSSIAYGSNIGNSAWLGNAVHVGMQCIIGTNATILHSSVIADKLTIGKQVLIERPGFYDKSIKDKVFFLQKSGLDITVISC